MVDSGCWLDGFQLVLYVLVSGLALAVTIMIAQHSHRPTDNICGFFALPAFCPFAEVAGIITVAVGIPLAVTALLVLTKWVTRAPVASQAMVIELAGHLLLIPLWFVLCVMVSATTTTGLRFCPMSDSGSCLRAHILIGGCWVILGALLLNALVGLYRYQRKQRTPVQGSSGHVEQGLSVGDVGSQRPMDGSSHFEDGIESVNTDLAEQKATGMRVLFVRAA